jgi:hypothetical protein
MSSLSPRHKCLPGNDQDSQGDLDFGLGCSASSRHDLHHKLEAPPQYNDELEPLPNYNSMANNTNDRNSRRDSFNIDDSGPLIVVGVTVAPGYKYICILVVLATLVTAIAITGLLAYWFHHQNVPSLTKYVLFINILYYSFY